MHTVCMGEFQQLPRRFITVNSYSLCSAPQTSTCSRRPSKNQLQPQRLENGLMLVDAVELVGGIGQV